LRSRFDVVFFAPWIGPLLTPTSASPPGGAETQIAAIGLRLAARGYRVCFVALDTPEGLPDGAGGAAIRRIRRSGGTPAVVLALRVARALAGARSKVVVQRAASMETGLTALVSRLLGRRFVYSSANVIDFDYGRLEPRRRNVALFRLGVRLASRIVVQTEEQARLCEARFGRRPALIKSAARVAESPPRPREAFLWIGRLVAYKRPRDLLRLAEAVPEARFRMVAVTTGGTDAALAREVRERAAGLGNVEWVDPRPREALLELMDSAVAIVNTADFEGMPNIFLEGWGRGVPALSLVHDPDGVIERERIGAFAHGDFGRFAAAARDLWGSRRDPGELAERCRAYVAAEHDPDAVVDRWVDALGLARPTRCA
jgi:glycosyltransferase involved in cell wall biosynthesis